MEAGEAWEQLLQHWRDHFAETEDSEAEIEILAEREARLEWIRERWVADRPCTICGNRSWLVSDPADIGPQVVGYPITCRFCGNTHLMEPNLVDLEEPVTE